MPPIISTVMRILVVEDEKKVASFLKKGLEEERYAVDCAYDGEEALFMVEASDYDLMILDIMIPKIDGLGVLERVRGKGLTLPVLMLTARDSVEDVVKGLDGGCDDYLTKPFAFAVLLARVRALLRRKGREPAGELRVADLALDPVTHTVSRGSKKIDLTAKEYALLEYLMRHANRVVTRTMISEHVWDYHFDPMTNVIDVYVNHLRSKIDLDSSQRLIHTVRGVGYMLKGMEDDIV
jgi:heavy metal response regulator